MKNYQILDDVVYMVVRDGRKVQLNCNGNLYTVELNKNSELELFNPKGFICEEGIYGLSRFLSNTVVDKVIIY